MHRHESITNPSIPPIVIYDILQILGLISNSAALGAVLFSSGIKRSTAWSSSIFSWVLFTISNLLIVGRQTGPFPDPILCLCQSMFIRASVSLCALTFTLLILEILLSLFPLSRTAMIALHFVPYGVFVGMLITMFILGRLNPTAVRRVSFGMYCDVLIPLSTYITSTIVIFCVITCLVLGVCIAYECRRQRRLRSTSRILLIRDGVSFGLVLRVGIIGIFSLLSLGVSAIDMFNGPANENRILGLYLHLARAGFPLAIGIFFGTRRDILCVLMFWRSPSPLRSSSSYYNRHYLGSQT